MLYIVLVLVLAAFGLLIAALTTANTLWAWISVGVSVVAAALLILDWLGGRRAPAKPANQTRQPARADDSAAEVADEPPADLAPAELPPPAHTEPPADDDAPPTEALAVELPPAELPAETTPPAEDLGEPGEEPTDAADLLIVAGLSAEVRVIDEHPRYHLASCTWLAGRATIPIAVSEARQLGFTPCVRCGPDAQLAAKHRADR